MNKNINNDQKCESKRIFHESLTKKTLIKAFISLGIITIICNGLGFLYLMKKVKENTINNVQTYTQVVVEKESKIFLEAENNNEVMKEELLRIMNSSDGNSQNLKKFDDIVERRKDGTIRNIPPLKYKYTPGVFLGKNVIINDEMKERIVDFFYMVKYYGLSCRSCS